MSEEKKIFDHLLTGLNTMIPFVVAGGIMMALGFALGGTNAMNYPEEGIGSIGQVLYNIGNVHTMSLMFLIVSGYIAYSIGGMQALLPGMVGGSIATSNGSTFLGAVISGFLAGYLIYWVNKNIVVKGALETVFNILVIPVISTAIVGLASMFLIGIPVSFVMTTLTGILESMQGGNLVLLCAIIGAMMAVDLAGPILRVAYFFGVAAVVSNPGVPQPVMAAAIVGGMIPPLGMALASTLQKSKFTEEEQKAGKAAWVLGASLITEGVIPFAIRDPKRVIPACAIGSACAGAVIAIFQTGTTVVHGGIFILPIPGAVQNPLGYILAVVVGTVVSAALVLLLKRNVVIEAEAASTETVEE